MFLFQKHTSCLGGTCSFLKAFKGPPQRKTSHHKASLRLAHEGKGSQALPMSLYLKIFSRKVNGTSQALIGP